MIEFKKYYAPLPDVGACLKRVGLDPDLYRKSLHSELPNSPSGFSMPHTKESLDILVHAFLYHIPFENIDIYDLRREVSLAVFDVYEKIVEKGRGGYCFELNALLFSLIEALGFNCYPVAQRILLEGEFPPYCHRATIVTLPDGMRCVCDCGFAGPAPVTAVCLDEREPQRSGKNIYRMDYHEDSEEFCLVRLTENGDQGLILFKDTRFEQVDFLALNAFMVHNVQSRFYNNRVLNLMREQGSVAIDNDILRLHDNSVLTEIKLNSKEELLEACKEFFGMPESAIAEFSEHMTF